MAVGLAVGQANGILDALLRSVAYSDPAEVWIKLHTGDPGAAGTSNAAANTTRVQATFAAASGGASTTTADLEWTNVPNAETYSHISAWSASAAGTFLFSDALNTSRTVAIGDNFTIPTGDLDVDITIIAA